MANITLAIPQLNSVPQCIYPAYGAIAEAGCGLDLRCICTDDMFWVTLQGVFAQGACSPEQAQNAMASTRTICTTAAPYLGDSLQPEIIGSTTILTIIAVAAVILRFLARRITSAPYGIDDWLILVALIFYIGLSTVQLVGLQYGSGLHTLMLDAPALVHFGKIFFSSTICFVTSCAALKLSVLYMYHRIFPIRSILISCSVLGTITILWFIANILANFLACQPFAYWWDKSIPGGHCLDTDTTSIYITSVLDIITNIAVLILPIPVLWGLQMHKRRKWAITIIFLLGSFATLGSIVRVPLLVGLNTNDASYTAISPGIWLNVEISIGILSASLPLMRPLLSHTIPSQLRSRLSSKYRHAGSHRLENVERASDGTPGNKKVSGSGGAGAPHGKTLSESGIYQGQNKKQPDKSWYNAGTQVTSQGTGRDSGDGSQEDMLPTGKIQVRHDLEWEQVQRQASLSQKSTLNTLG